MHVRSCARSLYPIPCAAYSIPVYWICGLDTAASRYFTFVLIGWVSSMSFGAMCRCVAYSTPTMIHANAVGGMALLLMVLTNGFCIVRCALRGRAVAAEGGGAGE